VTDTAVSNGDKVAMAPGGDYDQITLSLKNTSTGESSHKTFSSGDTLMYTADGNYTITGVSAEKKATP